MNTKTIFVLLLIIGLLPIVNGQSKIALDEKEVMQQLPSNGSHKSKLIKSDDVKPQLFGGGQQLQPQAACSNMDFESGTTSGWTLTGDYKIVSTGNDVYGGFPRSCPGGKYSLKLGGDTTFLYPPTKCLLAPYCLPYRQIISTAQQNFAVSNSNALLTINYALVLLDFADHTNLDGGAVIIQVYDNNGNLITCATDSIYAIEGTSGLKLSPHAQDTNWTKIGFYPGDPAENELYKPWTPVTIDLRAYVGTNVTLKITNMWCVYNVDWCYCYIDCSCSPFQITHTTPSCSSPSVQICATPGLQAYSWKGPTGSGVTGDTTNCVFTNTPGIYTVQIQTSGTCPKPKLTDTIFAAGSTNVITAINPPAACVGQNVTLTVNSNHPYSYSWSPGSSTDSVFTLVSPGTGTTTYTVTGTDANGCTATTSVTVVVNPNPSVAPTSTPAKCGSSNGTTTANASKGTSPYSYSWSNGNTSAINSNLLAGTYTVSVSDKSGCGITASVTVLGGGGFVAIPTSADILCYGGSNGSASVAVTNGAPPYIYNWSNGQSSSSISGLSAGIYTCLVKDQSASCTDTIIVTLTQPAKLQVQATVNNISCNGVCDGKVNVVPNGATAPYTYAWSNSATLSSINAMCAGSYSLTLSDKNNCTLDTTVSITEPTALTLSKTATPTTCGKSNGSASVNTAGGTAPYFFSWNTSATTSALTNISSGTYLVTVKDGHGCQDTIQVVVPNVSPEVLSFGSPAKLACHGDENGSLTVTATGNGSPYTYSWSVGGTANTLTNLVAGIYTVSVTDKNGCVGIAVDSVTQPAPLLLSTAGQSICAGESATLTANVNGGTNPYTYLWSNNSNGSSLTDSPAKTAIYSVVITDANGCTTKQSDTIKVNSIPQAAFKGVNVCIGAPSVFTDSSNANGGIISSWQWNFGDGTNSILQNPNHIFTKTGTYTVSLSVSNGPCETSLTQVVTVYPAPQADFAANPQPATVDDPVITFTDLSKGGLSGWWDFGDYTDTTYATGKNPVHTYPGENVPDGETYIVKLSIVNQYGCLDSILKTVHIDPTWTFYAPDAFSPNGDGRNDLFYGTGIGITEKEMWIFDRWGLEIFHSTDLTAGWDGKVHGGASNELVQQDVYSWVIQVKEVFGRNHKYIGHVTVVK